MERNPFHVFEQDHTGCDHQFTKRLDVDPILLMSFEIDPTLLQQVDTVGCVHVVSIRQLCTAL